MNIQQLKYLIATADEGTMTAAAASLYVAQPALSRAVRSLERELGVTVFDRSSRGARLTPAGEVVVARARRVLRSLAALQQARDGGQRESPFTIAASPTLQAALAIPILRALGDHGYATSGRLLGAGERPTSTSWWGRPGGPRHLRPDPGDRPGGDPGRQGRGAVPSPAALVLPDPLPLTELAGIPLVLPTMGSDRRAALDAFYAALGVDPFVAVESDERSVWMEAVRHGLASCLWHSLDSRWLPPGDVTVRSLDPPLWQELSVVHRAETEPDPRLDVVRRYAELVVGG